MKKLNFNFKVCYTFSQPIQEHCFALRILPKTNEEQGIYAVEYHIFGGNACFAGIPTVDGFGNQVLAGQIEEPHDRFEFTVTGTAFTRRECLRKTRSHCEPMYRYPSDLTRPGPMLRSFYEEHRERVHANAQGGENYPGGITRNRAVWWMYVLQEHFQYMTNVTDIRTTAEEAMAGGRGVCQDYSHILIALLRMDGIPARYVAGMLIGEGATHAWCEAFCEGYWVGLDPTHGCWLTDDYIEIAHGRDYRDCIMDRGCFRGFASQCQEVYVKVEGDL